MHASWKAPGARVALVLTLTVAIWACESPTDAPASPDASLMGALAKGGNGNGNGGGNGGPGGDPEPLNLIELTGPISTAEGPQDAGPGSRSKNKREIGSRGHDAGECDDPGDTTTATGRCFRSELNFGGQLSACQGPSEMPGEEVTRITGLLQDGVTKARWSFSADISMRRNDALLRVFWYEATGGRRYDLLVNVASAQETPDGSDVWEMQNGTLSVYHDPAGPVTCDWTGQIDMTITPDTSP